MNKVYLLFTASVFLFFTFLPRNSSAQPDEISPEQLAGFKADVQNLVSFLEYSFNTLGDPATTTRDKDVIINESYAKIFRDAEVQVEDDLDETRETLINKDVQAYLKDIDFFFSHAVFSLNVSSIDHHFTDDNELFFVVTLTRTLNGRTVTGDTVASNRERFIEVNYDEVSQDLRIASIYTTRIDERDELYAWWNKMPGPWRDVLGHDAFIKDTIRLSDVIEISDTMAIARYFSSREVPVDTFLAYGEDTLFINEKEVVTAMLTDSICLEKNHSYRLLQRISSEKDIDISGNLNISTLEPLAQMGEVRKVNCAGTLIDDLSPLRNLIDLESLDCSGTAVSSIAPLQYSVSLKNLDLHSTLITDLSSISKLRNMERLNISNTPADSLQMLASMTQMRDLRLNNTMVSRLNGIENMDGLQILDFSYTYVTELEPLRDLKKLERLYLNSTPVDDLDAVSGLDNLQTIYLDSSNVSNLQPLDGLPKLESIYCDNTGITRTSANEFMSRNNNVMVIYESVALGKWWQTMTPAWREVFRAVSFLDEEPSKEQLHELLKITDIEISGNEQIKDLAPLKKLTHLRSLDCERSGISGLWPLSELVDLRHLDCSHTTVSDCEPLHDLTNLEYLDLSHTRIRDIQCISRIKNLRELNINGTDVTSINVFEESNLEVVFADETGIGTAEAMAFRNEHPATTVVYQSAGLQQWWDSLTQSWKKVFMDAAGLKHDPGIIELQRIANLTSIDISRQNDLGFLHPLQKLPGLRSLRMKGTQISDLKPISEMTSIEELDISNNPVEELWIISGLKYLRILEFENTQVSDLEPLVGLTRLSILNLAGTDVRKLDDISRLTQLEEISFYNTRIKSLSPLESLPLLKLVKCYNTRLKDRKIENFREIRPDCEIIYY